MTDYQSQKSRVLQYYQDLENAAPRDIGLVLRRHTSPNYAWRGVHPFNELESREAVAEIVWQPLWEALGPVQRRQDIFMAGTNEIDGGDWVISMGHLMGLFDKPWLGIPPTGRMAFLRYAEFHRIQDGRLSAGAFFCDIIGFMKQAGLTPLPMQTGAELLVPGPRTHDGLLLGPQDPGEGVKTLASFSDLNAHLEKLHPIRYVGLLEGLQGVFITGLKPISKQDDALRFVHFVDKLYDREIRFAASGCELSELFLESYKHGGYAKKYARCVSRLGELLRDSTPS